MEIELLDAEGRPVVTHDHEWTRRTRRPPSAAMAALGVGAFTALVLLVVSGLVLSFTRSHLEADLDRDVRWCGGAR